MEIIKKKVSPYEETFKKTPEEKLQLKKYRKEFKNVPLTLIAVITQ